MEDNPFSVITAKLDKIEGLILSSMVENPEVQETLPLSEAAKLCQISSSQMYQLSRKGIIPSSRIGNRYVFIKSDLLSWLREQRQR